LFCNKFHQFSGSDERNAMRMMVRIFYFSVCFIIAGCFCLFLNIFSVGTPCSWVVTNPIISSKESSICLPVGPDLAEHDHNQKERCFKGWFPLEKKKTLQKTVFLLSITMAKNIIQNNKQVTSPLHYRRMKSVAGFKTAESIVSV